jgi:adenine phosphoribosyltransferase
VAVAQALSAGFVPVRKPKKLPAATIGVDYALEYGTDRLEMHRDAIAPGQRVLMVDDLLATGGTMKASCELVTNLGANIIGTTVLIELTSLQGRRQLETYGDIHAVLQF